MKILILWCKLFGHKWTDWHYEYDNATWQSRQCIRCDKYEGRNLPSWEEVEAEFEKTWLENFVSLLRDTNKK